MSLCHTWSGHWQKMVMIEKALPYIFALKNAENNSFVSSRVSAKYIFNRHRRPTKGGITFECTGCADT